MIYQNIITVPQLKEKLDNNEPVFIVDTREHTSFLSPINLAVHIPASKIIEHLNDFPKNKTIVIYCSQGVDSFFLMNLLITEYGFTDVFSLKSGIEAWHKFIDAI